jgi:hypothetical protein
MMQMDDDELRLVVKSLSITYDSISSKLDRLPGGRWRDEALAEFAVCDRVLAKARREQTERVTHPTTERTG